MNFFNNILKEHEKTLPKRPDDPDVPYTNWKEYNYPSGFELINYHPEELTEKRKSDFVSVI
jgi:hypothetical protein